MFYCNCFRSVLCRSNGQEECYIYILRLTHLSQWELWFCVNCTIGMVLDHFTFYYYSLYFWRLVILNILLLNPKKSSDFISILMDFTLYIVKSVDFLNICKISSEIFNICKPNIDTDCVFPRFRGQRWSVFVWLFHLCSSSSTYISVSYCTIVNLVFRSVSVSSYIGSKRHYQFIIQICYVL